VQDLLQMQCTISGVCTTCASACNHNHHHKPFSTECAGSDGHLLTSGSLHSNCASHDIPTPVRLTAQGAYHVRPICTSAAPVKPTSSFLHSLCWFCSGPLVKNGAEHINCLHKSYSLPGEIKLPGQDASPPVKVPKGMRSTRSRRQGPNAATALGVKRNGGTSRVAKTSSTVQDEFIKVCPHHHHHQFKYPCNLCHCVLLLHCQKP